MFELTPFPLLGERKSDIVLQDNASYPSKIKSGWGACLYSEIGQKDYWEARKRCSESSNGMLSGLPPTSPCLVPCSPLYSCFWGLLFQAKGESDGY